MKLVVVPWSELGPPSDSPGRFPALAWTNGVDVYVRRFMAYLFFGRGRIVHEVEHIRAPDFKTNANHHPWWHLCGRVGHAVRVLYPLHVDPENIHIADELRFHGEA